MTKDNYSKAYKEVLEILKYVPIKDLDKLPTDMLEMFRTYQNIYYEFKIDITKSLEEQNLLVETKAILANIFRDYWATPYQRERILAKENYDTLKEEEEKRNLYNPNEIFKKRPSKQDIYNNLPIEIKKEKFYEKLIKFIKKLLNFK